MKRGQLFTKKIKTSTCSSSSLRLPLVGPGYGGRGGSREEEIRSIEPGTNPDPGSISKRPPEAEVPPVAPENFDVDD